MHEPVHELLDRVMERNHFPPFPMAEAPPPRAEGPTEEEAMAGLGAFMDEPGAAAAPPPGAERFVNVAFAAPGASQSFAASRSLAHDGDYVLRVAIGTQPRETIVRDAPAHGFDAGLLPAGGAWLDVVVASEDLSIPHRKHAMFLPDEGDAWACSCRPGSAPHTCDPGSRAHAIDIPVRTPREGNEARLRLVVYCMNNVVQSQRVRARLAPEERDEEDALESVVDYTLTRSLRDAPRLAPAAAGIMTNDEGGVHRIVLNAGGDEDALVWHFGDNYVDGQLKDARYQLAVVAAKNPRDDPEKWDSRGDMAGGRPLSEFAADVRNLARFGAKAWQALASTEASQRVQALARLRREGGTPLHIARAEDTGPAFPWALVYDIPLYADESRWRDCDIMQDATRLADASRATCPLGPHKEDVICPYGFWGVRFDLANPASSKDRDAEPLVRAPASGALLLTALNATIATAGLHGQALARINPTRFVVSDRPTREGIRAALADANLAILYFFCHGRNVLNSSAKPTLTLVLGAKDTLDPGDVINWFADEDAAAAVANWRERRPLVFINGCSTVRVTPDSKPNFVDVFSQVSASGIVGTEIPVMPGFAEESGRVFLEAFESSQTVGTALRRVRHAAFARGNVLGLAYTAYAPAGLRLEEE